MSHELVKVNKAKKKVSAEELKLKFPQRKNAITKDVVDEINKHINDPEYDGYGLVQSMVANQSSMIKNSLSLSEYTACIRFSSFLLSGDDATTAYKKTFGERQFVIDALIGLDKNGSNDPKYKQLTSAASRYRTAPQITDILKMAMLDTHLMYMNSRHAAFGVLIDKMHNSHYDKDQIAAADMFLKHTEPPKELKMELEVGVKQTDMLFEMMDQIRKSVEGQKSDLERGRDIMDVQVLGIKKEAEDNG